MLGSSSRSAVRFRYVCPLTLEHKQSHPSGAVPTAAAAAAAAAAQGGDFTNDNGTGGKSIYGNRLVGGGLEAERARLLWHMNSMAVMLQGPWPMSRMRSSGQLQRNTTGASTACLCSACHGTARQCTAGCSCCKPCAADAVVNWLGKLCWPCCTGLAP
jgi:hypothetical protein